MSGPRAVKCGLAFGPASTGCWQVCERSHNDLAAQHEADVFYIRNWSIWLAVCALARTPLAVLSGSGVR